MKYTLKMTINLPRAKVAELFGDRTKLTEWQQSLDRSKLIEGTDGEVGAKYELSVGILGKMYETITKTELPDEHTVTYEGQNLLGKAWNEHRNLFADLGNEQTEWTVVNSFKCTRIVWIMTKTMPWLFRWQSRGYMKQFKRYAEAQ